MKLQTVFLWSLAVAAGLMVCYTVWVTVAGIRQWRREHILYYLIRQGYVFYIYRDKKTAKKELRKGDRLEAHVI